MLFRNIDGRHFERVPWHDTGKTWGVLASDLFGSGHPSLYLANDMAPGDLWERKGSRWTNRGTDSGTAYDAQGQRQGGMAVDSGDYDNDGRLDLLVTTYYSQPAGLYHNDGGGLFTVTSNPTGLGPPTMPYVKFGGGFADFNNDGWLDILIASGHVRDNVSRFDPAEGYRQPIQLFLNQSARFTECSAGAGIAGIRAVARGVAFGDYNRDGREDVLICNLEGKAMLLENISDSNNHWLEVRLAESGMNRFALGATVTLTAGSVHQLREIRTCGSVLSAREPVAHFGLGGQTGPCTLEIRWPNGRRQSAAVHRVDQSVTISYAPRFAGGGFAGGGFAGVNAEANGREPR
jgi:hypothetical protein